MSESLVATHNGITKETVNGRSNDHTNGHSNGTTIGTSNGTTDGASNGITNGASSGTTTQVEIDPQIAISPNAPDDIQRLLDEVASLGNAFTSGEPRSRSNILEAARSLVYAVETPREAMIRYCWCQPATFASIETSVETKLFEAMARDDKPKTVAKLADVTGTNPVLLARIMKHLSTMGVVAEARPDVYRSTGFSKAMTIPQYGVGFPCMTGCVNAAVEALPEFLRKNGYKNGSDPKNCAFQIGYRTPLSFFEHLGAIPEIGGQFNSHMGAYRQGRPSWMDKGFFPVQENLINGAQTRDDSVFLVDVGGSWGHDVDEFRRKWPQAPGRAIVQDQPHVIEDAAPQDKSIELTVHDFFTEQPVKGARAYYMHSILHDWPDEQGHQILSKLAAAMTPGYSKLLLNENVIPDTDAHWETTCLDIIMLSLFGATERTERQFRKLVEGAGLKIVKIWTAEKGVESLIECELA